MSVLRQISYCAALLLFSTPICAAEKLDCTFTVLGGEPSETGHATVEIESGDLVWKPSLDAAFHYHVIQDNDIGVVAVAAGAELNARTGPIVAANVLAITKTNMSVRMGSVGTSGAHDILAGVCQII